MNRTSVQLDADDDALLDLLATEYGGRSSAIRAAIRELGERRRRRDSLKSLLDEWESEDGTITEAEIERSAARFGR